MIILSGQLEIGLGEHLEQPGELLVAMEATGHYWKNVFVALVAATDRLSAWLRQALG